MNYISIQDAKFEAIKQVLQRLANINQDTGFTDKTDFLILKRQ